MTHIPSSESFRQSQTSVGGTFSLWCNVFFSGANYWHRVKFLPHHNVKPCVMEVDHLHSPLANSRVSVDMKLGENGGKAM